MLVPRFLRHSRESGNPGVVDGFYSNVSPRHPAWIPAFQAVSKCPLSLWERVGVREPRGKQAGVNGNEWERQGYWGPSPGLRPPSPRGRGVGFGTGRTGLRPPSPRGRGVGFGTGRTGLRPLSPRGRGVLTRPVSREMTISGVCASLGWGFDTPCKAEIQGRRRGGRRSSRKHDV